MRNVYKGRMSPEIVRMRVEVLSERLSALEEAEAHIVYAGKLMREACGSEELEGLDETRIYIRARLQAGYNELEALERKIKKMKFPPPE